MLLLALSHVDTPFLSVVTRCVSNNRCQQIARKQMEKTGENTYSSTFRILSFSNGITESSGSDVADCGRGSVINYGRIIVDLRHGGDIKYTLAVGDYGSCNTTSGRIIFAHAYDRASSGRIIAELGPGGDINYFLTVSDYRRWNAKFSSGYIISAHAHCRTSSGHIIADLGRGNILTVGDYGRWNTGSDRIVAAHAYSRSWYGRVFAACCLNGSDGSGHHVWKFTQNICHFPDQHYCPVYITPNCFFFFFFFFFYLAFYFKWDYSVLIDHI